MSLIKSIDELPDVSFIGDITLEDILKASAQSGGVNDIMD